MAGGSGKGAAMVAVLVVIVQSLSVHLAVRARWLLLNPETVDNHQSSHDIVSPMPARADSRPVSTVCGRETGRRLWSPSFSLVREARLGGTM